MKRLTLLFLTIYSISFSQAKFEVLEFSGKVMSLKPGWGFALEIIELQVGGEPRYFRVDPIYGKSILSKIKVGEDLSLKANVNLTLQENLKKTQQEYATWGYRFMDQITEIQLNHEWIQTPQTPRKIYAAKEIPQAKIFLEQKVEGEYFIDGFRKGLIFKDGMIAFASYVSSKFNYMKSFSPGDKVSFMGYESPVKDEFVFPIQHVKKVYSFIELKKITGKIESFIIKQNFVRIGLVVNGKRLSFPAESARVLEQFSNDKEVTAYFGTMEDTKTNLLPTIHAIIQESDTLYFTNQYYGGPDGKHEYKAVQVEGPITKVNRNDKGRIISLIVSKDCYLEIDPQMDTQLGNILKKGTTLKVSGEERIKKEGEIYEKDYRIITPKRIVAEEKEYIVNQ